MSKLLTLVAAVATLFLLSFWTPVDASARKLDGVQNAEQTDLSARRYRRYYSHRYYARPYSYNRGYRYGYRPYYGYYWPYYYGASQSCGYTRVLVWRNGHRVWRRVNRCW